MAAHDNYQIITDRIISLLEQGVAPWHKPWSVCGPAQNLVSGKQYRGINTFLLGCSQYDSPYWLTYKQATERGGHVRKGEKATPVIFWKLYEKEDEDGENVKQLPVLRQYSVFNSEQCEGIETPAYEALLKPENERIELAEAVQLAMPNRPTVTFGGNGAYYSPLLDMVNVPALERHDNSEEFYPTRRKASPFRAGI